jgi:hypothetical protein
MVLINGADTSKFVDDTITAVTNKAYLPGAPPTAPATAQAEPDAPKGPAAGANGPQANSRKRAYNDQGDEPAGRDSHYGRNAGGERAIKQPRRGGMSQRGSMFDNFANRGGRLDAGRGRMPTGPAHRSQPPAVGLGGMPGMPPALPGFPFDPNDPMMAIQAMQAMGFPPLPAMPPFPQPGSPPTSFGFVQRGQQGSPSNTGRGLRKIPERCKDYDQKGFCALGGNCPYEHGTDHITVPADADGKSVAVIVNHCSQLTPRRV